MTNELSVEESIKLLKDKRMEINYKVNGTTQFSKALDMTIKALEQKPKTGHWIEKASTYYEELNKRGLGVDEYTPYFTDDIACSECLAKYSVIDNETQFFKFCPNCGAKMVESEE